MTEHGLLSCVLLLFFFFQAEDGIRDYKVTGVQTCALPIFSFDQAFTRSDFQAQDALSGNGLASMLLGYPGSGSAGFTANPFFQWIYLGPRGQDDFKVTRRATLDFGLQWGFTTPGTEPH